MGWVGGLRGSQWGVWGGLGALSGVGGGLWVGPPWPALPWQRPPVHNHPGAREQLGASSREVVDQLGQLVDWSCKWSSSPRPTYFKQSVGGGSYGDGHCGFSVYSHPLRVQVKWSFRRLFFFSQNQSFPFQCCPQSQCILIWGWQEFVIFSRCVKPIFRWRSTISNPHNLFSVQNSIQLLWDLTFSDNNVTLCNS